MSMQSGMLLQFLVIVEFFIFIEMMFETHGDCVASWKQCSISVNFLGHITIDYVAQRIG